MAPTTFGYGLALVQLIPQFRSLFSEFDSVGDADVATVIKMASAYVDAAIWSNADYGAAMLFLAAHFLSIKQMQLASTEMGGTGETDIFVRMIRMQDRTVTFQQRSGEKQVESMSGPGESLLGQTWYGQQYLMLRARNVSAVAIV